MVALLVLSVATFGLVPKLYFPDSSRRQLMIDYWAPEGTRIQETSAGLERIEQFLQDHPATLSVSTFIGKGPPRFYLPVSGEDPYTSYAQIIVNTHTLAAVAELVSDADAWAREFFTRVIGLYANWNYSPPESPDYQKYKQEIEQAVQQQVAGV